MTISEKFKALMTSRDILRKSCLVYKTRGIKSNYTNIHCENVSEYIDSLNNSKYCFTLFSQLKGEPNDRYIIDYDLNIVDNIESIFDLTFNRIGSKITFICHTRTKSIVTPLDIGHKTFKTN